jgi:hypothetical protein
MGWRGLLMPSCFWLQEESVDVVRASGAKKGKRYIASVGTMAVPIQFNPWHVAVTSAEYLPRLKFRLTTD